MRGDRNSPGRRGCLPTALALILALAGVAHAQAVTSNMALIQRLYGLPTAPALHVTNPTVGATASNILLLDPAAIEVTVINLSTNTCEIAPDNLVSTTRGIELASGGGSASIGFRDDLSLPTNEWWAICSGAGSSLLVLRMDLVP